MKNQICQMQKNALTNHAAMLVQENNYRDVLECEGWSFLWDTLPARHEDWEVQAIIDYLEAEVETINVEDLAK